MQNNGIKVKRYSTSEYGANVYCVSESNSHYLLVDVGCYNEIQKKRGNLAKVTLFLTHAHYDHIEDVHDFMNDFPSSNIYLSKAAKEMIADPKKNLSFYHEQPIACESPQLKASAGGFMNVESFSAPLQLIETPGHTMGCLSYKIGNYLFTGDSWIPGIPTVTKLKGGNRELSNQSLDLLKNLLSDNTIVCPGHGPMISAAKIMAGDIDTSWVKNS